MNVISYSIEIKRKNKDKDVYSLISEFIDQDIKPKNKFSDNWDSLPFKNLKSINSSAFLLASFSVQMVDVYIFKNSNIDVADNDEITFKVFAVSEKEINNIIKSSYLKIKKIFEKKNFLKKKLEVEILYDTSLEIYPFDTETNDITSPSFFIIAEYEVDSVNFSLRDYTRLSIFGLTTIVFIILFFNTPAEIPVNSPEQKETNNMKEVYSILMGAGIVVLFVEFISNVIVPWMVKQKSPKVRISNFSNMFKSKGLSLFGKRSDKSNSNANEVVLKDPNV